MPDASWAGIDERGVRRTIALADYFEPCASTPRLLVIRVSGGVWCGTCRWHAAHTGAMKALSVGPRLRLLDLVVGDADDAPATPADLEGWRRLVDDPRELAIAADPDHTLRGAAPAAGTPGPLFVFVGTRTMRVRGTASNPSPADLASQIEAIMAQMDGAPAPAARTDDLIDGFAPNEWDLIRDITVPGAPPPDPSNAVADAPAAAALGQALFSDATLSPSGSVSCATCHAPSWQLGQPEGDTHVGRRKAPSIALSAHARWQFWDGRADSLWAQALGPLENPEEMASSRVFVVRRLADAHATSYANAFPEAPLPRVADLHDHGRPGAPAYDALPDEQREAVTRAFVNAGKAVAAYERRFRVVPNRLDAYASGDLGALSPTEKLGLATFVRAGCIQCHWGPRLTDDAFHVTRMPGSSGAPDLGRATGIARLEASEFHAASRWSDAPLPALRVRAGAAGAFKTPPLRGVASARRFGHGGALASLVEVTELYGHGGASERDVRATGVLDPWLVRFGETSQWALPPLLGVLTGEPILPGVGAERNGSR